MQNFLKILRWSVGILFIFSGLIKGNDPLGFSYKLEEYFEKFSEILKEENYIFFEQAKRHNFSKFSIKSF